MDSTYTGKGELRSGTVHKIFIKTDSTRLADLQCESESARPYAVTDFLYIKIDSGEPDYLDWITTSIQ